MSTKIPVRFIFAVAALTAEPNDHVVETGCGTGVAASLLLDRLPNVSVAAIDRSPTMIRAALPRNQAHVHAGRATFQTTALAEANLDRERFDRALAVNAFWLESSAELNAFRTL